MEKEKRNFILIFSDQQRWDTVGVYGNPMDLTPNIDKLAENGVKFEYAFTNQPVCGPARGCLFTGKYATNHGVWKNGYGINPEDKTVASIMKENGYVTGYVGKWHLSPHQEGAGAVPEKYRGGFEDFWEVANVPEHTSHPYEGFLYDKDGKEIEFKGIYRVDFYIERAIEFIKKAQQPFFLTISYLEPHQQNDWKRMVAPEGYAEKYRNPYVPPDLKFFPGDWFQQLPDYYGAVKRIDECVGKIVEVLQEKGIFENTVIIYTTDHGCHFKTRNTEYKRSCHESSVRIPLIISGGRIPSGVIKDMVCTIDIPATILDMAGVNIPEEFEGESLLPVIEGKKRLERKEIFIQISEYMVGRAIRTERWKYCVVAPDKSGVKDSFSENYIEYQLYDLYSDPYELVNLAGREEYKEVAGYLRERLKKKIEEVEKIKIEIEESKLYP
ncbi:sulfatase-like hydrolase/transferase [bacterium]|nr:sulfatase-like hydrolase/transferase [bacterium]